MADLTIEESREGGVVVLDGERYVGHGSRLLAEELISRIERLEAENARLWSALAKVCDDNYTDDPAFIARRYFDDALEDTDGS